MSFRARGFEREVWGENRGFESIGLKLLPATSGWKVFYFQHRRDRKVEHPALRWAPFLLAGVVLLANVGS